MTSKEYVLSIYPKAEAKIFTRDGYLDVFWIHLFGGKTMVNLGCGDTPDEAWDACKKEMDSYSNVKIVKS